MKTLFVTIVMLFAVTATDQDPPSAAQAAAPTPSAQIGDENPTESGPRTILKFETGEPFDAILLNRSRGSGGHETYFFPAPDKRSGVMIFRDDALGTTIGVVATDLPKSNDLEAGWLQERRFWQEKAWCINVTSLGWSEDGRFLFVATSDIYGSGNIYQLDLEKRRAAVIFPVKTDATLEEHCWSTHIETIGSNSITVSARDYCDGDRVFARETLPFLKEEQMGSPSAKSQPENTKPDDNETSDLNTKPSR